MKKTLTIADIDPPKKKPRKNIAIKKLTHKKKSIPKAQKKSVNIKSPKIKFGCDCGFKGGWQIKQQFLGFLKSLFERPDTIDLNLTVVEIAFGEIVIVLEDNFFEIYADTQSFLYTSFTPGSSSSPEFSEKKIMLRTADIENITVTDKADHGSYEWDSPRNVFVRKNRY